MTGLAEAITAEILSWPGVSAEPHRFGGTEFRFAGREIGHLHGDHLADLPFPARLRDQVIQAGLAEPHHILPATGWVSCWLRQPQDAATAIRLFRMQYDRLAARDPSGPEPVPPDAEAPPGPGPAPPPGPGSGTPER